MHRQLPLIDATQQIHEVMNDGVYAKFEQLGEMTYDVTLDINSQKFLISISTIADRIEQFEVRVAKSFYDVTQRVVLLLKRVVSQLWAKIKK